MAEEREAEILTNETKVQNNDEGTNEEIKTERIKKDTNTVETDIENKFEQTKDDIKNKKTKTEEIEEKLQTPLNNQEDVEIYKLEFPANRIKRIIHSNEEIGKIGVLVPGVVSVATELFIKNLVTITCENTNENRITISDIKKAIKEKPMYDFISMMELED